MLQDHHNVNIKKYKDDKSLKNEIILRWSVPGPVFIARKELYEKNNMLYNESLIGDDWDMYLKLVSTNSLGFIDLKVSAYRMHDYNTCTVLHNKILQDRMKTIYQNIHLFNHTDKFKLIYVFAKLARLFIIQKLNGK